jgi:hypothetical protein
VGTVLIQACLPPKPAGDFDGFDPNLLPPTWLISAPVDRSVMRPAERDGELVADLAAERTGLR